jgi:CheY-like chemotaxis protein
MNSARVLIVEDDATLRSASETVLKMEGYQVYTAADGLEALEVTKNQEVDVIILDMLMPNINGMEFLEAFQAPELHPDVKIIVFSNMSIPSDVKTAMKLGATKYLTKSNFTPKEMVSIIQDVLE